MHRVVVLYYQPDDPDHFRNYYVNKHIPLASKLPGLVAMRYGFDIEMLVGDQKFFCIWEGDFPDAQTMAESMSSEIGRAVDADTKNYASGGFVIFHYEAQA
ncbi:MAG: EthD family reductase [Alicyclobacillaceae bacterium]|nr:EthD family reductase [Alicyclobacillaceae bacterium]